MGDPYYDPYQDMGEGDMLAMYAQMNPQLFGNDPAKRLNYYQDLMSTLGTDLVQTAGVTNPAAEQYVAPMNQTGTIYGSDPLYASIFQAIEDGADPISAAKAAREAGLFTGTQDDFNAQVLPVATQYAGERVKNMQDQMSWEAENAGGYTMPDGSKYKQTPLGGNDVRATASEYELMGAPDPDALFQQYLEMNGTVAKPMTPKKGMGLIAGVAPDDAKSWKAMPAGKSMGGIAGDFAPGSRGVTPAGAEDIVRNAVTGVARQVGQQFGAGVAPQARLAGGNFFLEKAAKDSINKRVEQSKNTQVRSDANRNLMRRITALAGLLQGGFPE